jgi:hypothetical protein
VAFDVGRLQVEAIWRPTDNPGVRVHATGTLGDDQLDIQVDITGGPPPRPAPVFGELPTACGRPARVWMCRPEAVAGQKLQALWQLGRHLWRPKDLDDLRLLLRCLPMEPTAVREAVADLFADLGGTLDDARALFASPWWGTKMASARWLDFVERRAAPAGLAEVVAEVAGRLAPILESPP